MSGAFSLGNESDEGFVDASEAESALMEGMTEIIEVFPDNRPSSFEKLITESIRTTRFIIREVLDDVINLMSGERLLKEAKINISLDETSRVHRKGSEGGCQSAIEFLPNYMFFVLTRINSNA